MLRFLNTSFNPSSSLQPGDNAPFNAHQHLPSPPALQPWNIPSSSHKARDLPAGSRPYAPRRSSPCLWIWTHTLAVNVPRLWASFAGITHLPAAPARAIALSTCGGTPERGASRPRPPQHSPGSSCGRSPGAAARSRLPAEPPLPPPPPTLPERDAVLGVAEPLDAAQDVRQRVRGVAGEDGEQHGRLHHRRLGQRGRLGFGRLGRLGRLRRFGGSPAATQQRRQQQQQQRRARSHDGRGAPRNRQQSELQPGERGRRRGRRS